MTARPIPLWDFGSPAASPLGLPMCQNRAAVPTWSYAMERIKPTRIIEIGSYSGGFAIVLGLHAYRIGCKVISFDIVKPDESLIPLAAALRVSFVQKDVFDLHNQMAIRAEISRPGVTYVLCDGGDKPRELAMLAAALKPGDVIAAHDYVPIDGPQGDAVYWPCGEITKEHGDRVAASHDLEPWMQDHFDLAAWLVYRKRGA